MNGFKLILKCLAGVVLLGSSSINVWAQSLENDAFVSAEITRIGQADRYNFTAAVGETIFITVADVEGTSFNPFLRLFDPGGVQVFSTSNSFTATLYEYEVLSGGEHSIIVQDSGADNIGKYSLYFVRIPGSNELGRLGIDTRLEGSLELGDIDTFTFDAVTGDRIHLNVSDKNFTSFNPRLWLYDPSGSLVITTSNSFTATLRDLEISATGVWTVVISDINSDNAGNYELFFTKVLGSNEKGLLPNDARRRAELALGDIDTWVFDAQVGDRIHISVADVVNSSFNPDMLIYDPQGALVVSAVNSFTASASGYTALLSGQYIVVVKDINADNAGTYELHFARAPGASEGGTLSGSAFRLGTLSLGDIDTFEFGAVAGGQVNLNVADSENTSFNPHVVVYDEDGNVVASAINSFTAALAFTAPLTGFYTVVVQDVNLDNAGTYTLDFIYIGPNPPKRTRGVVLEPMVWHLLGVPGATGGTLGELFEPNFELSLYDDDMAVGGWAMFGFEATTIDPKTNRPGVYRKLSLSEPVPQGTGFWLIHNSKSSVRVNLPINAVDARGTVGGGCDDNSSCISTPLVTPDEGGWTIGAVPSTLVPSIDTFRFLTDSLAPLCNEACTMDEAAGASYAAPNGVWVYEPRSNQYRLRSKRDSIAPWTGFWLRANMAATPGSPELLLPVGSNRLE